MANDPAREAAASLRGYWAQIWCSVLAWMDLGEAERLYLEGAEDFDRVSGLTAETVQVKDVTGNVTLRSSDVIEAIDNAWAHRQRNPRHTIKFRFLTTGGIGVEQGGRSEPESVDCGFGAIADYQMTLRRANAVHGRLRTFS